MAGLSDSWARVVVPADVPLVVTLDVAADAGAPGGGELELEWQLLQASPPQGAACNDLAGLLQIGSYRVRGAPEEAGEGGVLQRAFAAMDTDGSGTLDREEVG